MVRVAEGLLEAGQRPPGEDQRLRLLPSRLQAERQVVAGPKNVGMLRPKDALTDGQDGALLRLGLGVVLALGIQRNGQVVAAVTRRPPKQTASPTQTRLLIRAVVTVATVASLTGPALPRNRGGFQW